MESRQKMGRTMQAVVIGAGPAGLMAAGELARAGLSVIVAEAKPSPARKFLMAGKSGLNLTRDEPPARFMANYGDSDWLHPILHDFGAEAVKDWARALGQPVFTGTSGRVFPVAMKGSPLLRAWLAELSGLGVQLRTRWRWTGWDGAAMRFETPDGERLLHPAVTILALGGASWPRLGSDGGWTGLLSERGIAIAPFRPANMGLGVDWSHHMTPHFGQPVKAALLVAGNSTSRGEFVISARGLEGGGIYAISAAVRDGADLQLDLAPDVAEADLTLRLAAMRPGESASNRLRKSLRLSPAVIAMVQEFARPLPADPVALARLLKSLPIRHTGPRPLAEAISSAGGIRADALTPDLMLKAIPGTFAAGEMLDWEAPTGGYLLTACFATGRHAGRAAARWTLTPT